MKTDYITSTPTLPPHLVYPRFLLGLNIRLTAKEVYHYDIWSSPDEDGVSVLDKVLRKLVEAEREKNGRKVQTTMLIVDSKSIQNADTAEEKGYDAGKKYLE